MELRAARQTDFPAITRIYNHYVEAGPVTFDVRTFTVDERQGWFAQFAPGTRHQLLVAEVEGEVRGYAGSMQFRKKPAYDTTVETTVYLDPQWTGRGLGAALYEALFAALADQDLRCLLAGITLPNPASIRLHERFGFKRPVCSLRWAARTEATGTWPGTRRAAKRVDSSAAAAPQFGRLGPLGQLDGLDGLGGFNGLGGRRLCCLRDGFLHQFRRRADGGQPELVDGPGSRRREGCGGPSIRLENGSRSHRPE